MKSIVLVAAMATLTVLSPARAKEPKGGSGTIVPGPMEISAAEKAIEADPAAGTEHALILTEETENDENRGSGFQVTYHLRAKILSSEGRSLGNVEIPTVKHESSLRKFWARTITADGRVFELRENGLAEQTVMKAGGREYRALKGVIPGVEPGAVIDFGYVLGGAGFYDNSVLDLQRRFAIKHVSYHWIPFQRWQGEYVVHGSESARVRVRSDGRSLRIEADDMRPFSDEPLMPPESEVRTTVTFFYSTGGTPEQYWTMIGGVLDGAVAAYGPKDKSLQLALAQMPWPPGADLDAKIRVVYDWVGHNIRNSGALSAEEIEAVGSVAGDKKFTARTILTQRYGNVFEIATLFASFVRALGGEANIALATDRNLRFWDPELKSVYQFSYVFVAVNRPGESVDRAVIVDPSGGLPWGELPWQATGTHAVVGASKGFRAVALLPTMADRNIGETTVALSFSADGQSAEAAWSFLGQGQQGRDSRATLRAASGEARLKSLDAMCGSSGWEVRQAASPDLEDRTLPFRLSCEIERDATNLDDASATYVVTLGGPWWPTVTDFAAASRKQPVIFPFPRTDSVRAEVAAPPGYGPAEPPPPVILDTPFGTYTLKASVVDGVYRVERKLVLKALRVMPVGYDALRAFFADVARADRTPLTFRRTAPSS